MNRVVIDRCAAEADRQRDQINDRVRPGAAHCCLTKQTFGSGYLL
jgi:hypothetical protein